MNSKVAPHSVIPEAPNGYITSGEAAQRTGWNQAAFSKACQDGDIKHAKLLKAKNKAFRQWSFPESELGRWLNDPRRRALAGAPNSIRLAREHFASGNTGPIEQKKAVRGSLGLKRGETHAPPIRPHKPWKGQPTRKYTKRLTGSYVNGHVTVADAFTKAFTDLVKSAVRAELRDMIGGGE